jgi:hypothetical protein
MSWIQQNQRLNVEQLVILFWNPGALEDIPGEMIIHSEHFRDGTAISPGRNMN